VDGDAVRQHRLDARHRGRRQLRRRWRLALDFAVAGGTIYILAKVVKTLIERGRPQTLLEDVNILGEPARGLGYVSGHSAVAIALATVAAPYLGRRARRCVWAAAISVCVFRVYVGPTSPSTSSEASPSGGPPAPPPTSSWVLPRATFP